MSTAANHDNMLQALHRTLHNKKVLIIDRNAPARESLRMLFGTLGVTNIVGVGTAADVVRQVKNARFDIIISEFVLDDTRDGQQLLEELRVAKFIPLSTVYMIITSERSYTNVMALAELAPDDYLIKPFTADQLQPRLIRAIYKKHILQKIYEKLEANNLPEALAACDRVIQQYPAFALEAQRHKGSIYLKLGLFPEAEKLYAEVIKENDPPWAKMGFAIALKEQGKLKEARQLALKILEESPKFLSVCDFLADIYTQEGNLKAAQEFLQKASEASPNNTIRQRVMGDVAMQNGDLTAAQKAFGKVIERSRGSTLRSVDDFSNLARVFIAKDDVDSSRKLMGDLKREFRGNATAELAAMTNEVLCLKAEGANSRAENLLNEALAMKAQLTDEALSAQQTTDLAMACLQIGKAEEGQKLLRQIAAENMENPSILAHVERVFEATDSAATGKNMVAQVQEEIKQMDDESSAATQRGDFLGAVRLLNDAVQKVPSVAFLIKAACAIFTLLDNKGWNHEMASLAIEYLKRARKKDPQNAKLASAVALYTMVAKKYGVAAQFST